MEYTVYDINRKIQQDVKAFGVSGIFLFFLMGWLIFSFIILIILKSILDIFLSSLLALVFFLSAYGISAYFSKNYGIRNLIKKIGSHRQPRAIFCKHIKFKLPHDDQSDKKPK